MTSRCHLNAERRLRCSRPASWGHWSDFIPHPGTAGDLPLWSVSIAQWQLLITPSPKCFSEKASLCFNQSETTLSGWTNLFPPRFALEKLSLLIQLVWFYRGRNKFSINSCLNYWGSNSFSHPNWLEILRSSRDLAGRWATDQCSRAQEQWPRVLVSHMGDASHMALPSALLLAEVLCGLCLWQWDELHGCS